jgi:hypothetical protein
LNRLISGENHMPEDAIAQISLARARALGGNRSQMD